MSDQSDPSDLSGPTDLSDIANSNANKADESYYEKLLDELYFLQKNLLHSDDANRSSLEATADLHLESDSPEQDFDSLEIPILTQTLNQEIDSEHQARKVFDEAQHHLWEQPDGQQSTDNPQISEEQVTAIVNKLMARLKPRVEQLLREKIRSKVIERFNRQT
ncbi:hypothetical protein OAI19_02260 [Porticoccaceae bacterium]|nr:hypothetical protein [Porticoccaceae bacterium]CAI8274698.1 MAG: Uncharacterised protein [SAR92 bacterium MED-G29]